MPGSVQCCACSRLCAPVGASASVSGPRRHLSSARGRPRQIAASPPLQGFSATAGWLRTVPAPPLNPLAARASAASLVPPSPTPSPVRTRPFSSSAQARAAVIDNPYPFPRGKDPSPFDIFHFRRDQKLTPKEVKARYLQLVKIYHPDRRAAAAAAVAPSPAKRKDKARSAAAADADHEFKAIVAAYELLSSPSRRDTYLRSGLGWGTTASFRPGAPASPWSQSTAEYHFRRGRPMTHGRRPASSYDHWAWSETWTDPHNPHFRPDAASPSAGATAAGWAGQGLLARNGVVFLVLAALTLTVTPLTAWSVVPAAPPGVGDPYAPGADGRRVSELAPGEPGSLATSAWVPRVYDKRHQDAAWNLQRARQEARERGHEKRDAIRRRVQEIRRVQALDDVREAGTGHQLALPAPVPAPAPTSGE
ncbi:hypothetical protein JCM3770_001438 [Rhodotorula araucariae]